MMPEVEFRALVLRSAGIGQVLNAFGLDNIGRNHFTARERIRELQLDTSHFNGRIRPRRPAFIRSLDEIMVEDSVTQTSNLKKKLIKSGLLNVACEKCGITDKWNGDPLVLILDHKNGKRRDHRLENLRFLCPNCHSQTPTFAGRNMHRYGSARASQ